MRENLTAEQKAALAGEMQQSGLGAPPYLNATYEWIERSAKLFEAGDYPDKGMSVCEEQLLALQQAFDLPVPLLIEHASSPLELGYLTDVRVQGRELYGTVTLTSEANALVERSGARSLSLGLSQELDRIAEVSLVQNPRVPSARLFREGPTFSGELLDRPEADAADLARKWMREGLIRPCQEPYVRALLSAGEPDARFGHAGLSPRWLITKFVSLQQPHGMFEQRAPAKPPLEDYSNQLLMPEEAEFYRRYFPDVSLDEIARRIRR